MNSRADRRRQARAEALRARTATSEAQLRAARGSESPDQKAHELREAFGAMEQEQWDDYQEYVKRCGGVPISKIEASRPVSPNDQAQRPPGQATPSGKECNE